ncbi:unnamed protein product [Spodoptera exigua]|nr:unnamed protein product [Spodoptera exigua]
METENMYPDPDPDTITIDTLVLEEMVKQERTKEITELHSLSKKTCNLHADLLYYRHATSAMGSSCYELWKRILTQVGGSPNAWRELGLHLGIEPNKLNYIMYSVQEDHVDMVLKVFRQNENATIDKIIDAFIKMKRYDILKSMEEPLCKIAQFFNKDDSGYQSKSSGQREVVRPKNIPNNLPAALSNKVVSQDKEPKKPKQPALKIPSTPNEPIVNDTPIFFLTYTQDGFPTAVNIQEYVENWTEIPNVQVITLNNKREELYQNPEKFIREYFEKADIIIPIITPGYLEEIKSHNPTVPNTSDNLDHKYVNFIYNLIVNNYIHASGCLNKKVRSVLPQNANVDLFRQITMYPDLMPWTYETNFDAQFQAFLKFQQQ